MTYRMKKCAVTRLVLLAAVVACIAILTACGSSSTGGDATYTAYRNYSTGFTTYYATVAGGSLLGGSIQKGVFSGKLMNYSTVNPAFGRFSSPISVAVGTGNSLYVVNYDSHSIDKVDTSSLPPSRFSGNGTSGFINSTTAHAALYYHPTAITSDGEALYVADSLNRVIRKIDLNTDRVTLLAGQHGVAGSHDGTALQATFNLLTGLTVVGTNLFTVDSASETVRMIDMHDPQNIMVSTFAGAPGKPGYVDGEGSIARFNQPARIASDGLYLYVTDFGNKVVRRISLLTGRVDTIAGKANTSGTTDGMLGKSLFRGPNGIATDGINLYVTDFPAVTPNDGSMGTSGVVRKITLSNFSTAAIATGLHTPVGIAVDHTGLYVSDRGTRSIIRIK